jgi:hypothetical protein
MGNAARLYKLYLALAHDCSGDGFDGCEGFFARGDNLGSRE